MQVHSLRRIRNFATLKAFEAFLAKEPLTSPGLWLKFAKKAAGVPSVTKDEAVDAALGQLRRAGAEMVRVYLPATQPALATVGAGLGALQLGFAAIIPRYGAISDALILQWVRDPEVDDSEWVYADERVEEFAHLVMAQTRELEKLAGAEQVIKVPGCESTQTNDLLRILGFRMRGGCGSEVVLETEGDQEQAAMDTLVNLFNDKFGEGE